MNPGFKYPIDGNVLRSKLLENTSNNMEQAWEGFEHYLAQQKPIFTESKKTRIALMIPQKLFLRGFLACLIILPSLLFYRQFNAKIPAAINKAYASSAVSKKELREIQKTELAVQVQKPTLSTELNTGAEPLNISVPAGASGEQALKKGTKHPKTITAKTHRDTSSGKPGLLPAAQSASPSVIPTPADKIVPPQIEQTGELNEQL